jgi:hypothetical protein
MVDAILDEQNRRHRPAAVVDFYPAVTCGPDERGQSTLWLGSTTVTTDDTGYADVIARLPVAVPRGYAVSATTTEGLNTSEYSPCVTVDSS